MKHINTQGIVLNRTDFGEADRIISFLTPDHGKVTVLAGGVRKQKSKLAGGIELFSVSDISFLAGRGEIYTLISTRLIKHYGNIVKDMERTNTAYELIRLLGKATEDHPEPAYFKLMSDGFGALDDTDINPDLVLLWFSARLLSLGGHSPNLHTDEEGEKLETGSKYVFNYETMNFHKNTGGQKAFTADHIKFLRLAFSGSLPKVLQNVQGTEKLATDCRPLLTSILQAYVRI